MRSCRPLLLLALLLATGCARLTPEPRDAAPAPRGDDGRQQRAARAAALGEALELATRRTVGRTARAGGFRDHPRIRVRVPDQLDDMAQALLPLGEGGPIHALELALNRAAERAAGRALPVFDAAIAGLRFEDPGAILRGPDDALTSRLRRSAGAQIREQFTPIVDESMRQVGVLQAYQQLLAQYRSTPSYRDPGLDLVGYVRDRTLDGLFLVLAEEEARLRSDPDARRSESLKRLFGGEPTPGR